MSDTRQGMFWRLLRENMYTPGDSSEFQYGMRHFSAGVIKAHFRGTYLIRMESTGILKREITNLDPNGRRILPTPRKILEIRESK